MPLSPTPDKLASDPDLPTLEGLPERYIALGRIAVGGMGEVWRVRDGLLRSTIVLKVCRPEVAESPLLRQRFFDEARLTAQLHHPGIIAVHDLGELPDGRPFFTMEEVRGRTFEAVIAEHVAEAPGAWTLRRMVDAFTRACQAVAYAHSREVIHRDLKPENLMVGDFGEVRVMDWGLARRVQDHDEEHIDLGPRTGGGTEVGDILGTPAYMSPEQAMGRLHQIGLETDIYALGAILYALLSGRPPYNGSELEIIRAVRQGPPPPLDRSRIPEGLCDICECAMARDRYDRYADAGQLAGALADWLDGAQRRAQALVIVEQARSDLQKIHSLRSEAEAIRQEASRLLDAVAITDPIEAKKPGWALQDRAEALVSQAVFQEVTSLQNLRAALNLAPDLPEAHALLADHYYQELSLAEQARDRLAIARSEALLSGHAQGRHQAFLKGDGALTLHTTVPASARLFRFEEQDRRLVPVFERELGTTPLCKRALPKGSYLVTLHAPGRATVNYPVLIERAAHWDGVPPEGNEPLPIWIPTAEDLRDDEIYVPAGRCIVGGDPMATDSLRRQWVWVDGFVMKRFPVTVEVYAAFLQALLDDGNEAAAFWPTWRVAEEGPLHLLNGRAVLSLPQRAHQPVTSLTWEAAMAFAATQGCRLPNELEWEKAARGADGRLVPWGSMVEPRWANVASSPPGPAALVPVVSTPLDVSPYGIYGLAGNAQTWCNHWWSREGPIQEGRVVAPLHGTHRSCRGGAWPGTLSTQRAASRFGNPPGARINTVGIRLVRSVMNSGC